MTPEKLRRTALARGAQLAIEGERFNSDFERVPLRNVPEPAPVAPAPKTAEPPAPIERTAALDLGPLVEAIRDRPSPPRDESAARALDRLTEAIARPRARGSWRFEIVRNANNLIESITAIPVGD